MVGIICAKLFQKKQSDPPDLPRRDISSNRSSSDDDSQTIPRLRLLLEDGRLPKKLERFVPDIEKKLSIQLEICPVPFKDKFRIIFLDLVSSSSQYDLYISAPCHLCDLSPYLLDLSTVASGGRSQVEKDLQYDQILPKYKSVGQYNNVIYGAIVDGDIKLLNYRYDLANDPKEQTAFYQRYGYALDMDQLTWERYLDVAEFFTRPDQGFYGTAELATYYSYCSFMDRYLGMGGHLFSYDDLTPFPDRELAMRALKHGKKTVSDLSPPGAKDFVGDDVFDELWGKQRVFMVPFWPDAWRIGNNPDTSALAGKIDVAMIPGRLNDQHEIERRSLLSGRSIVVRKTTPYKELAYKVLVYFSQLDVSRFLISDKQGWLDPWLESHFDPNNLSGICDNQPHLKQRYIDTILDSATQGYPDTQILDVGEYQDAMEHWISMAWHGELSNEEALEKMVEEFEAITNIYGRENQLKYWRIYVDEWLKPYGLYP